MKRTICIFIGILLSWTATAVIIHIPADYPTIQHGINAADNGDTVLVQPGTYLERINFKSKNITVGSLYLITGDTSYITQTIIDADSTGGGAVVEISGGQDSTSVLCGFTITGCATGYKGGGVYILDASPCLRNLLIRSNTSWNGGGIAIENSSTVIQDVVICNNRAYNDYIGGSCGPDASGGGIHCLNANPTLINIRITDNTVKSIIGSTTGAGIYCCQSNIMMQNVMIAGNVVDWKARDSFGGGGGIMCYNSTLYLSNVKIVNNRAKYGGGISGGFNGNSVIVCDSQKRSDIYMNQAPFGNDLWNTSGEIILDTFTVLSPTEIHAYPIENYSFDILNGKLEQVEADLFVSPEGDNNNSGLSDDEPLQNTWCALVKILTDSLHPHTIHLLEGNYSKENNGEIFPFTMQSYISLSGESRNNVILDAASNSGVFILDNVKEISLSGLTVTGGYTGKGSGIECSFSNIFLQDLTITGNTTFWPDEGGGIYCNNSFLELKNILIKENVSGSLVNVTSGKGGGMYVAASDPIIQNSIIESNHANYGGGMYCSEDSKPILINSTIRNNTAAEMGGGLYNNHSLPGFDGKDRSDIYLNQAIYGNDLYSDTIIHIVVDTFTVLNPTEFHAESFQNFTFDILHGKIDQVYADLYVSHQGNNSNSGLSPEEPLKTIRYAMSAIFADNNSQNTIHLLEGTYSASENGEFFPLNLPDYINLQGISEDHVILNAENQSEVLIIDSNSSNYIGGLIITGGTSRYGCGIYIDHSNPSFEHVSIINNTDDYDYWSEGGGIYCNYSNPTLQSVTISNNRASKGGGIYCYFSNPNLQNVEISNNSSMNDEGLGGGIYCLNSCPVLQNVTISGNSSGNGGGIYCEQSNPIIQNTDITNNSACGYQGIGGGGICCINSNPVIQGVNILNNTAYEFAIEGGGGICCIDSDPVLSELIISGNLSTNGGGIYLRNSNPGMQNVTISNNSSGVNNTGDMGGGGICCKSSNPVLQNVQIVKNHTDREGGGIVCNSSSNPVFINVTLADNSAGNAGGAVYAYINSNPSFVNSILWNNIPEKIIADSIDISYSDIQGGWEGEGNIDEDPIFKDSGDYPYLLSSSSPCINRGDPDTTGFFLPPVDLMGNPRIWNERIDMGAYEWNNLGFENQSGENENQWLRIYPNPAEEDVFVQVSSQQSAVGSYLRVMICDLYGKEVRTLLEEVKFPGELTMKINISDLPAGLYLVRVQAGRECAVEKLVVK